MRLGEITSRRKQREEADQHRADGHRRGTPGIAYVETRRPDDRLVEAVLDCWIGEDEDKGGNHQQDDDFDFLPQLRRGSTDERRQTHVRVAPRRQDRAEGGKPHEQRGCQFIGPDEWIVEEVARHHAGEQQRDLENENG